MTDTGSFCELLQPQRVTQDTFKGVSLPMNSPAIYGGQLMAQVLSVAADTLPEVRAVHYLQTNFVAFGDPKTPLEFKVTRVRDGKSISHRQVTVTQGTRTLLLASLSFQGLATGYDHQLCMPNVADVATLKDDPSNYLSFAAPESDFPFLILNCPKEKGSRKPVASIWAIPRAPAPKEARLQQMLFAFLSDATILQSAMAAHALDWEQPGLFVATMNHSIWFHRPIDINSWLLLHGECPSTSHGRALSVANAYNRQGELLATVAQEGVLRPQ